MVSKTLQGGDPRDRDRGGFFECDVGRFRRDRFTHGHILGKRSVPSTKDFIAGLEIRDAFANRLDHTCKISAQSNVLWPGQAAADAGQEQTGHSIPLRDVHGGGVHSYQHAILRDSRLFNVYDFQYMGRAIRLMDNSFHGCFLLIDVFTRIPTHCGEIMEEPVRECGD